MTDLQLRIDEELPSLAWMVLDRPQARNAWSDGMLASFCAALDRIEQDRSIRVVALTGAGKAFSAGGDLKAMRDRTGMFAGDSKELRDRYLRGIQSVPRRLARFDKPIIAAVNGAAIGAGLDLSCMCDLRICSTKAKFGSTFVKVGLVPGDGGAYLLTRAVGYARAAELILTGRVFDAQEALGMGLVSRVVEPSELEGATRQLASGIAANSPVAVQLAKAALQRSADLPLHTALELAATYQGIAQHTQDHMEGVHAILERRTPDFEGR